MSSRRVRVAFSLDNLNLGGTELNAVRLTERLDPARFELSVITLQEDGPLRERFARTGARLYAVRLHTLRNLSALRKGVELRRYLRSSGIEILHAHDIYSNVFSVPCARAAGLRTIASRRWWEGLPGPSWRTACRTAYQLAHITIANSPAVAQLVRNNEGVPARRVRIVPNFLDESAFVPPSPAALQRLRAELRIPEDALVIGIVANLLPIKDHTTLLRAFALLANRWPRLHLVLVGDGECRVPLQRLAAELQIDNRVAFAGLRGPDINLHHFFDISVLCSISEGLPNSVLEAMAAARPVVATNVGAVADALQDGVTGLLVPAGDPASLARALEALLSDRRRATEFGAKGRERARTHYSADAALRALEDVYLELAARRPRPRSPEMAVR